MMKNLILQGDSLSTCLDILPVSSYHLLYSPRGKTFQASKHELPQSINGQSEIPD